MAEPYKLEQHRFDKLKGIPWLVCKSCGLIKLKNEFTNWCVRMGCNSADHPGYRQALSRTEKRPTCPSP